MKVKHINNEIVHIELSDGTVFEITENEGCSLAVMKVSDVVVIPIGCENKVLVEG